MGILATFLFLLLLGALFYIWFSRGSTGGNAPGLKLPEPEPEPQSGTYYEITNACYTLSRSDSTGLYTKLLYPDSKVPAGFLITNTTVKGLPPGVEALLTHSILPHGSPDPNGVARSTTPLTDGKSTAEFNGRPGIISRSVHSFDLIKWDASLSVIPGSSASLPVNFEVCIDVRKDV